MMAVMGRSGTTAHRRKSSSDSSNPAFSETLRTLELAFQQVDRTSESYRRGPLPGGPTVVKHACLSLMISSAPTVDAVGRYAGHLKAHGVKQLVRVCDPSYSASRLRGADIAVHDWAFADGDAPPQEVVDRWLALLDDVFGLAAYSAAVRSGAPLPDAPAPTETVAVHCLAGLGRAPVLVAVALVETGMDPFEAVGWIRALRRGAINSRQMAFLENYQPRSFQTPPKVRKQRSNTIVGSLFAGFKTFRPKSPLRSSPVAVSGSR